MRSLAYTLLAICAVLIIQKVLFADPVKPGPVFGAVLALAVVYLLRRGAVQFAAWVFILCLILVVTVATSFGAGPFGASWVGLPIAAVVAGWLLGVRMAIVVAVLGLGCLWSVYAFHVWGRPFPLPLASTSALTYSVATVMGAIFGTTTYRSFARQLGEVTDLSRQLQTSNDDLERRVNERTQELTQTLDQLKGTQLSLFESEKLAALGTMVAGISHELNTPIGIAVTVTSTLQSQVARLAGNVGEGRVKRSELEEHLKDATEMLELLDRSVRRAADLIANFKQVANDQTSEQRREFDLRELITSQLTALGSADKYPAVALINSVPEGILCENFPGPLGQIVLNMVQNAMLHAFNDQPDGRVEFTVDVADELVKLHIRDNGCGMDATTLAHAFDPFFTTRLGKGGSGLGLPISKRIANGILGGDITVVSAPQEGSCFTVSFVRRARSG